MKDLENISSLEKLEFFARNLVEGFITGKHNLADFFTKSLPEIKFKEMMHKIVQIPFISLNHFHNKKANRANRYKYNKLVNEEVC